jgi:hypothetical protein
MAPHAENNPIGASSPFPVRSSSYRAYSVIIAYGGDPGIQFSPTEEENPYKESKGVWNDVQELRTDEPLSYHEIDETYGSDMDVMAAIVDDEYDPYRPVSPAHVNPNEKEREVLVQKIYDRQVSQKQVDDFIKVRAKVKEKALPPMPNDEDEKQDSRKRTDSAVGAAGVDSLRGKITFTYVCIVFPEGSLTSFFRDAKAFPISSGIPNPQTSLFVHLFLLSARLKHNGAAMNKLV